MKATVVKRVSFCAAHFLPNYKGKCKNMHGHTWSIEVGISGEVDSESGMVVDFVWLGNVLKPILENLDHHTLNDIIANPTAENIASYIYDRIPVSSNLNQPLKLEFIRVWESPDSYAEVRNENL